LDRRKIGAGRDLAYLSKLRPLAYKLPVKPSSLTNQPIKPTAYQLQTKGVLFSTPPGFHSSEIGAVLESDNCGAAFWNGSQAEQA